LDPEKSKEAKERGNELFKSGKYPEAIKEYSEAIKRNPSDPTLFTNRAAAYTKLGAYPEGIRDCNESLKLDPKSVKAFTRKGHIHFFMKEFSQAMSCYEKGLEFEPGNKELNEGMERVVAQLQKEESKMSDEERLKKAMNDPEVQSIMGDPAMRLILDQISTDPKALQDHLKNPVVLKKIQKLMEAGILRTK